LMKKDANAFYVTSEDEKVEDTQEEETEVE
jgi:hypothetical protein